MTQSITTRPSTTADTPLLFALFTEEKAAELAPLGLSTEQLQPLLEMQYRGRDLAYGQSYANLSDSILCLPDGTSVGRLLVDHQPDCYRVIDLAVLAAFRGKSIATQSLQEVQLAAERESLPVRLQVSRNSPAQRLYQRLGFAVIAANELSLEMEWRAPEPASSNLRSSRIPNVIARLAILAACMVAFVPSAFSQAILTVTPGATAGTLAGTGTAGYSGDNGAATGATFASPSAVAYDASGDLFIADTNNNVIREVSASGTVTTIAGNGQQGFSGDGGAATSAELNTPTGIAVDASGNLYIADSGNNRIRKVSGGTITTIAGTGTAGYSGDGSAATSAELDLPSAVALDGSGNLYIADTDNNVIREIKNGTITTIAGNGQQGYSGDGGAATSASLDTPSGVAVDASGNIFIADTHNQRIREVSGATITTVAGSGPVTFSGGYSGDGGSATSASLARPTGIAIDASGNIYIADTNNNRLRKVGNGSIATVEGTGVQGFGGDGGAATSALLNAPSGVALNSGGNAVVADALNERVRDLGLPTLTFPSQNVGIPSAPQYITLADTGTGTLNVQSLSFTGSFQPASGGTCSALPIALTASQSCTQAIVYMPTAAGTSNGSVVAGGSGVVPQTVLLTGSASVSSFTPLLNSSLNPANYGQSVTFTAAAPSGLNPVPTGTMTFSDGATVLQTVALVNGSASLTTPALSAGTHSITAAYSGNASWNPSTSSALAQVINPGMSTINLTTSAPAIFLQNPVTFTATVASGSTVPTGTVVFMDGTTPLGSVPLTNGMATLTISSLAVGTHSITAVYSGNSNLSPVTSAALSELVEDFSLNFVGGTPPTIHIFPGNTVVLQFAVSPVGGSTFPAGIQFSVNGLPSGAVPTFIPATISSGAGTTNVTLTVKLPSTIAKLDSPGVGQGPSPLYLGLLILPFAGIRRRSMRSASKPGSSSRKHGLWLLLLLIVTSAAAITGIAGCGTKNGFNVQKPQSYTFTITGTSVALSHSATAQVVVE